MNTQQFLILQDQLVTFLWPALNLWLVLFVAGGILLALYHVTSRVVRERML